MWKIENSITLEKLYKIAFKDQTNLQKICKKCKVSKYARYQSLEQKSRFDSTDYNSMQSDTPLTKILYSWQKV